MTPPLSLTRLQDGKDTRDFSLTNPGNMGGREREHGRGWAFFKLSRGTIGSRLDPVFPEKRLLLP